MSDPDLIKAIEALQKQVILIRTEQQEQIYLLRAGLVRLNYTVFADEIEADKNYVSPQPQRAMQIDPIREPKTDE